MIPLASSLRATTRTLASASQRYFSNTAIAMGVTKTVSQEGTGPIPKVGDKVTIEYTGYLKDSSKPGNKGEKYAHPPTRAGLGSSRPRTDGADSLLDSTPRSGGAPSNARSALARSSKVPFFIRPNRHASE